MCAQVRKERTIGAEHVPGDHIIGEELEDIADSLFAGPVVVEQAPCLGHQLAMQDDVLGSAGIAGSENDRFLVGKVLENISGEGVDNRVHAALLAFAENGRQQLIGVGEKLAMAAIDEFVAAFVRRVPDELNEVGDHIFLRIGRRRRFRCELDLIAATGLCPVKGLVGTLKPVFPGVSGAAFGSADACLLYTSPSPRD